MPTAPPRSRAALLLLLTATALILGTVLFVLLRGSSVDRLRDLYNTQASISREATWRRPDPPPNTWELLEGKAAQDYQQAWELIEPLKLRRDDLTRSAKRLAPTHSAPPKPDSPATAPTDAPPPTCAALGVTPALFQRLPELSDPLCEQLKSLQPALQLAETGSRRQDSSSPARPLDPWTYKNGAQPQSFLPFMQLGYLLILQSTLDRAQGDEARADARLLALLRLGEDMEHGGGLISAIIGAELRQLTLNTLYEAALRGELSEATLERVAVALRWTLEHRRYDATSVLRDDLLISTPYLLTDEELEGFDLPMPRDTIASPTASALEQLWRRDMLSTYHRIWTEQLNLQSATCAARFELSERQDQQLERSLNPMTRILAGSAFKLYEVRLQLIGSQLAMLQVVLSDLRYQRRHGAPAPDADALRAEDLPVPDDPLTQRPLRWLQEGNHRILRLDLPPELETALTQQPQLNEHLTLPLLTR